MITTTEPPVITTTEPPVITTTEPPVITTTVPVAPVADESTDWPVLVLLPAIMLASLLSAGLFIRAKRHPGRPPLVEARVAVKVRPGSPTTFETRPSDEPGHDHVLAVVPVEVQRSTTVEENHP